MHIHYSAPRPYTCPYLLCLFSDITVYKHVISNRIAVFVLGQDCVFLEQNTSHFSEPWNSNHTPYVCEALLAGTAQQGSKCFPNTSLQERAAQASSFSSKIISLCQISLGVQFSTLPPTPPALGLVQGSFQECFQPWCPCFQLLTLLLFLKARLCFSQIFFFLNSCSFQSREGCIYSGRFPAQVLIAWYIPLGLEHRPRKY